MCKCVRWVRKAASRERTERWRASCVASERRERERVTGREEERAEEEGDWEAEKGREDEMKQKPCADGVRRGSSLVPAFRRHELCALVSP